MEKSPKVLFDESPRKKTSTVPFNDLNDCATHDACDFEPNSDGYSSNSSNENSQDSSDGRPNLKLNIANHFKAFEPVAVLSPISELAMNVAKTNLVAVASSNIKGKNRKNRFILNTIPCMFIITDPHITCHVLHVVSRIQLSSHRWRMTSNKTFMFR